MKYGNCEKGRNLNSLGKYLAKILNVKNCKIIKLCFKIRFIYFPHFIEISPNVGNFEAHNWSRVLIDVTQIEAYI